MAFIPYTIRSFRGGISDENNRGIAGSCKFSYGLDIHKKADTLTCKQKMAKASGTTVVDLINFFVAGSDSSTYCFGDGGKIYSRNGAGTYTLMATDANGEIKGASEWQESGGDAYLVWSTSTSLARKLKAPQGYVDFANYTVNYKTDLTASACHPIGMASGALMVGNDEKLAMYGFDGSWTNAAMNIRPGHKIKCLEERDDYAILGSGRGDNSEQGHIWSWITSATNYVQKKKIPVKGINALIYAEIMLMQGGTDGELFYSDFTNVVPVHSVPGGGQVNPGGIDIEDGIAMFGFYGGTYPGIWSYGRRAKNRPFVLNYDYRLSPTAVTGSTVVEIGAIAEIGGVLLASWKTTDGSTTEYGVDEVSTTLKATAVYEGLEFDAGSPHLKKRFRDVHIIMSALTSGCSVAVKVKLDKASSWTDLKTTEGSTSYSTANGTEAIFLLSGEAKILEVGITLTPSSNSSPEILSIITFVEKETSEYV